MDYEKLEKIFNLIKAENFALDELQSLAEDIVDLHNSKENNKNNHIMVM